LISYCKTRCCYRFATQTSQEPSIAARIAASTFAALKGVMKDESKPAAARVGAAIAILDRGWGKPMQAVEANVSVFDQMTDDEQKNDAAALEALRDA
jgi:hypothetical protein